ncbi:ATP-binding cassette domain-containing protein [Bacillus cereus]|uniref:ATP-binding cassette domain-containing protein n=1 Tax=Bacillus cereus TaxID=1396 RepID=UPI0021AFBCA1|nr:ATP-binding cassette domain-containing protein [Bacillus cereus]
MTDINTMISIRYIKKSYGDYTVIKNLSIDIRKGEIIGLLGPNGAGKTTLISILSTLTLPDEGYGMVQYVTTTCILNGIRLKKM